MSHEPCCFCELKREHDRVYDALAILLYTLSREETLHGDYRQQVSRFDHAGEGGSPEGCEETPSPVPSCSVPDVPGLVLVGENAQGCLEYDQDLGDGVTMRFVLIRTGAFMMGSPESEVNHDTEEGPAHLVRLNAFLIAKYAVTRQQWRAMMGSAPSHFKGDDLPVDQVSWDDCKEFCAKTGLSLPTEAQWEYACRAGTTTPFHFGATITPDLVNYDGNYPYGGAPEGVYREKTVKVGSFPPNAFGLHDMHGNVWEWCEDVDDSNFYGKPKATMANPVCSTGSSHRILWGGGWFNTAGHCRSAGRKGASPSDRSRDVGFRPSKSLR